MKSHFFSLMYGIGVGAGCSLIALLAVACSG